MSIQLSDEICNTEFINPMDSEDMKHYDEHLALAVLRYCFDEYDSFLVKDSPDLQSPDHSIGIEVTEVAVSRNKTIDGDYMKYRKTKDKKYIAKIKEKGGSATEDYYIVTPVTKHDELKAMKDVFDKKLKKICSYKKNGFNTLGLIMVMTEIPIPYTAFEWGKMIHTIHSVSNDKFDKIFFTYPSALSVLDCNTGEVEFKIIDSNKYDLLEKYARIMAEKKE